MEFPRHVIEVIEAAYAANVGDVEAAVDAGERAVRRMPDFNETVDLLIRQGVQVLVWRRHQVTNRRIKKEAGAYGGPPKVVVGRSELIAQIAESVYNYHIC